MLISTGRPKYLSEQASLVIKGKMVKFNIAIQPQVLLSYSKVLYCTVLVGFEEPVQNVYFPLHYIDTPDVLVLDISISLVV